MLTQPVGVSQIYTTTAPGGLISESLIPVQPGDWKDFCLKSVADAVLTKMQAACPNATMSVVENIGEEGELFVFSSNSLTAVPRVWMIQGAMPNGDIIGEFAGYIADRQTCPAPFIDNTSGNVKENTLQYVDEYGFVQFFYGAPPA